ncbi:MAG: hypothetical protein AAFY38_02830 [Pseudomonadota bacterium]
MRLALPVLLATLAFAASPFLVPDFGGFDPAAFPIPQPNPPVQPAGYAFSIWGVIYLWLLVSAGFGLLSRAEGATWGAMRAPLLVSLAVGAVWLLVAVRSPVWASVLIWVMLGGALAALYRAPVQDRWLAAEPVALYAGWLSAASVVSLGLLAAGYGLMGGVAAGWAGIVAASGLGFAVQWSLGRAPFYGVAVIWALAAVAVRNAGETELMTAALAGAALVGVATARAALR